MHNRLWFLQNAPQCALVQVWNYALKYGGIVIFECVYIIVKQANWGDSKMNFIPYWVT
jgi:hypothetical protein